MSVRLLAFAALVVLFADSVSAQEKVDNPEYANWSKYPKGTSVTRVWTSVRPDGRTSVVTETLTLLDVAADKVVLEEEYISDVPGSTKFKTKPKSREVPKAVPPSANGTNEDPTKLSGTVEEAEAVKVPAGEFKARWF